MRMGLGFGNYCDTYATLALIFTCLGVLLVLHHFRKHRHDLHGMDRCCQIEDVCVLCTHGRFSHEMFVALFLFIAYIMVVLYVNWC